MEPDTKQLIKVVKHLLVDKGIDFGHRIELRDKVAERLGRSVHRNTIYNALKGYRSGVAAKEVLTAIQQVLTEMPDK